MMAKEKARWRQGIVVSREGEPDKPATEDMALHHLKKASAEKDLKRRGAHLFAAQVVSVLGRANEPMVDLSTFKPGRPRGSRLESIDAPMQAFMEETSNASSETRKWTLARLAVVHFDVPEEQRENSMRRLVRWWTSRD